MSWDIYMNSWLQWGSSVVELLILFVEKPMENKKSSMLEAFGYVWPQFALFKDEIQPHLQRQKGPQWRVPEVCCCIGTMKINKPLESMSGLYSWHSCNSREELSFPVSKLSKCHVTSTSIACSYPMLLLLIIISIEQLYIKSSSWMNMSVTYHITITSFITFFRLSFAVFDPFKWTRNIILNSRR